VVFRFSWVSFLLAMGLAVAVARLNLDRRPPVWADRRSHHESRPD
jgi:hypothetical protein